MCVRPSINARSLVSVARVYTQPGQPIQEQWGGQVCPVTTQGRLRTRPRYTSWCTHGVNSCKHIGQRVPCLCLFRGHDVCATLNYSDTTSVEISWIQLGNLTSPENAPPLSHRYRREGKKFSPSKSILYFILTQSSDASLQFLIFLFLLFAMSNFNINPHLPRYYFLDT